MVTKLFNRVFDGCTPLLVFLAGWAVGGVAYTFSLALGALWPYIFVSAVLVGAAVIELVRQDRADAESE